MTKREIADDIISKSQNTGIGIKRMGQGDTRLGQLISMNTLLCNATQNERNQGNNALDADKSIVVIERCFSYSIAKGKEGFIGEMKECNMTIQGVLGRCKVTKRGQGGS